MMTMAPQRPGHAPGWSWRKGAVGMIAQPWKIPAHLGGICESGWHLDCPQAPLPALGGHGTCLCECHLAGQLDLFSAGGEAPERAPRSDAQ